MLSDSISDRTIALLFPVNLLALTQPSNVYTYSNQRYKSTMQMCRRICAPPEISIRIFNPLSSFFYSTIAWCRLICRKKSECISDLGAGWLWKKIWMLFGSQILIFYAVGFFALLNNSCISDSTIVLLFPANLLALTQPSNVSTFDSQRYKSTMQMCRRICAPPEINIRIFNPLSSFFYSTIAWCRLIYGKNLNVFQITN